MARKVRKRRTPAKIVHVEQDRDQVVGHLRYLFQQLKDNALYCATEAEWMAEVRKQVRPMATPEQWLQAAEQATTKCDRCRNGVYSWGACINGRMQFSAACFRCQGKGRQNQSDYRRNQCYDNHRRVI